MSAKTFSAVDAKDSTIDALRAKLKLLEQELADVRNAKNFACDQGLKILASNSDLRLKLKLAQDALREAPVWCSPQSALWQSYVAWFDGPRAKALEEK